MFRRRATLFVAFMITLVSAAFADSSLHYYWQRFPRPETVLTVKSVPSRELGILLDTLGGLAARDALNHHGKEMIWSPLAHPSYERWFRMMLEQTGARPDGPHEIWDLVSRFKERGAVKGYILYRYDDSPRGFFETGEVNTSANVATSLCALYDAIAVSEKLEAEAKACGLAPLVDTRDLTEEACFAQYKDRFDREVVALQDPKANEIRSESVALGAFILTRPGALYEKALSRLKVDTPVLGWGIGDEMEITKPTSQWAHFITATNWCHNLPLLSTETPGETYPASKLRAATAKTIWDLSWEDDVHYASFIMSDGDNVQWLVGDFMEDAQHCYWSAPDRGRFPLGWTFCYADLAQLCPYALEYLFRTASANDDFVLFGGGYYYPDLFGIKRPDTNALQLHARRIASYMRLGHLRSLAINAEKWNSPHALAAYAIYAREMPDLDGIFAIQYAPYTAGGGAVKWIDRHKGEPAMPVVSARFSIWGNANRERDDSPTMIASHLNAMPHAGEPKTDDHFSWVIVHAWSWFKEPEKGAPPDSEEMDQKLGGQTGTARGVAPVKWCVERLDPHVKVVTPAEFLLLMHLRQRPEQTLSRALAELEREAQRESTDRKRSSDALNRIENLAATARKSLQDGDYHGCFNAAKELRHVLDVQPSADKREARK